MTPVGARSRATGVARLTKLEAVAKWVLLRARAPARARKGEAPPLRQDSDEPGLLVIPGIWSKKALVCPQGQWPAARAKTRRKNAIGQFTLKARLRDPDFALERFCGSRKSGEPLFLV